MNKVLWASTLLFGLAAFAPAVAGIAGSAHDLSVLAAGTTESAGATGLCSFCHAPHDKKPQKARWGPESSGVTYMLYSSSTLQSKPGQPTGASRLCLACHDGTLAPAHTRSTKPGPARSVSGDSVLGTDLSDDHPISFTYDSSLATIQGELANPATLPRALVLDREQQMQCTTCHDPHQGETRKFLRIEDRGGALCVSCHQPDGWEESPHATSPATNRGVGAGPWPHTPYSTVSDNACENCHRMHGAPHPDYLLTDASEAGVCLACHDGNIASRNLQPEFQKASRHPVDSGDGVHEASEDPELMPEHVVCGDCHDPHQSASAPAEPPLIPGSLHGVSGLDAAGSRVGEATYEYEVCLKCHGVRDETSGAGIVRQDNTRNVRLEISQNNASYHPITAPGRNQSMRGFESGYSTASIIFCTDCHNNDEWTPSGKAPRGAHGSRYAPILEKQYRTDAVTPESYESYELCYKCHNQSYLLGDQARTFSHDGHVRGQEAPCAACHDAHGSRENSALINFMLRDPAGEVVVTPTASGRLEYQSAGAGRGMCYLQCHGKEHDPEEYP
jgi:predicted CXXCH cytochrome family protein